MGSDDYVVLEFRDARGVVWWKRSDDTTLNERRPRRRRDRIVRFVSSNTLTVQTVLWWLAMRAIRKRPEGGPPQSWRLYMWLTGGIGPEADNPDPILDRNPPRWPHSPSLRTTLFGLHPQQLAQLSDDVKSRWRDSHDRFNPHTWPLGRQPNGRELWSMLRAAWSSSINPFPALVTGALSLGGALFAVQIGQSLWVVIGLVAMSAVAAHRAVIRFIRRRS